MYGLLALKPKWVLDLRYASLYPAAALNTAIWKRLMLAARGFDRERHMSCPLPSRSPFVSQILSHPSSQHISLFSFLGWFVPIARTSAERSIKRTSAAAHNI